MRYWKKVWPGGERAFIKKSLFSSPAGRSMNLNEWADEERIHYTIYKTAYTMSYEGDGLDWSKRAPVESLEQAQQYVDVVAGALGAKGEAEWVPDCWGWLRRQSEMYSGTLEYITARSPTAEALISKIRQ